MNTSIPKHIKISDLGNLRLIGTASSLAQQLSKIAEHATLGRAPSFQGDAT
jgi:hypothetical protein